MSPQRAKNDHGGAYSAPVRADAGPRFDSLLDPYTTDCSTLRQGLRPLRDPDAVELGDDDVGEE